uniref:Uncharacterized protein n=1 Tax=viral metagenome TaxID=1070528 RepID=A0A6C0JWK5_9ZZZZ
MVCKGKCGMMCKCKIRAAFFTCEDDEHIKVQTYLGEPGTVGSTLTGQAELSISDGCCGGDNNLQFWTDGSVLLEATEGSARVQVETNNIFIGITGFTGSGSPPANVGVPAVGFGTVTGALSVWDPFLQMWLQVSGTGGFPGATGVQGATGSNGPQGADGPQGGVGPQGPVGADGVTGSTGPQGPAGVVGATGMPGVIGATGSMGATGSAGPQGSAGVTGSIGPTGMAGATGSAGPQGNAGPVGSMGSAGVDGATGATGPQGGAGPVGMTGSTGPQGPQGATGVAGATGITGASQVGIFITANTAPSANYLRANGQAISQATYPALFNQVGITPSFNPTLQTVLPTNLVDLAYATNGGASGIYVGIGSNQVYRSRDTNNWNRVPTAADVFSTAPTSIGFCSGLGMFVVANATTTVYTSVDSLNWNASPVGSDATVSFVACSPTTILVGGANDTDNGIQNVWSSVDGVAWTKQGITGSGFTISTLYYSPGMAGGTGSQFILGTSTGAIQVSPSGAGGTWTARASGVASQLNQFASGGTGSTGTIIGVGNAGVITASIDNGVSWLNKTYQTSSALSGISYNSNSNTWLADGASVIMTSPDGITGWATMVAINILTEAIFFGNGLYAKVGQSGLLATSSDLNTWTSQVSAVPTVNMVSGTYGVGTSGPRYVICGDVSGSGTIQSSPDAITWTRQTSNAGANILNYTTFYPTGTSGIFVTTGNAGKIITSPDGDTWTSRTSNLGTQVLGLAFNTNTIVAVAVGGQISSSQDGVTWTAQTSNTIKTLQSVAWNGSKFAAVGNVGTVVTSPDGTTWTKQSPVGVLNNATWNTITSDGITSFYAAQGDNTVFISNDGIGWTGYALPLSTQSRGIIWSNNQLVAYSFNNDIATSSNGKQWTMIQNKQGTETWNKSYYFPSLESTILTQTTAGITKTTDNISFTGQGSNTYNDIAYSVSQTKLVAVGNQGSIQTSIDGGSTWIQVFALSGSSQVVNLTSIAYSPSLNLYATVSNNAGIWTSPDGATWTQQIYTNLMMGNLPAASFQSIIWAAIPGIFVAVGGAGTIATSPDGITWTNRTANGSFGTFQQVVYNSSLSLFVIAGGASTTTMNNIYTSPDAITWTEIPSNWGDTLFKAIANLESNGFVIIGNANINLYSKDGITWNQVATDPQYTLSANTNIKALYSSVDKGAFYCNASGNSRSQIVGFVDGNTTLAFPVYCGDNTFSLNNLAYDSVNDVYVAVGANGIIARLPRSYNKSTQFVLPVAHNQFVKVL